MRLAFAECRLAFVLEQGCDGAAGSALDDPVDINEGKPEPARQLLADGGLAAPGQADQRARQLLVRQFGLRQLAPLPYGLNRYATSESTFFIDAASTGTGAMRYVARPSLPETPDADTVMKASTQLP